MVKEEQLTNSDESISSKELMLSTSDNPFNPFKEFDSWFAFDLSKGYNTLSYLANLAETSDDALDLENTLAINEAIMEAVNINLTGNRIVVEKE